jgi:hypothetical protein
MIRRGRRSVFYVCLLGLPFIGAKADDEKRPSAAQLRQRDKAIRARLKQGDLDSMVNLLLLGTSFTRQPRIKMENLTEASKTGLLRARVDDLIAGLRSPGDNEHLLFLREVVQSNNVDLESPEAGRFIYSNLQRVAQERLAIAQRAAKASPASLLDRASLFYDRGVSLDTGIFPNFSIEQTLLDLKQRRVLREGQIARAAVIGPGLDFIDKNEESAYDYYPPQTVQPFAMYDSLVRLGLARSAGFSMTVFDISPRVLDHFKRARDRARKNIGYTIQLPRAVSRPWPLGLVSYWSSWGEKVGTPVDPIRPPAIFPGLQTRAVRIRPEVVLACQPVDLNIVVAQTNDQFDLMVGTNVFLYYDEVEQKLALENAGAMLKPGGLLLTNDKLPESPAGSPMGSMTHAGTTVVRFDDTDPSAREAVGWYRRQ